MAATTKGKATKPATKVTAPADLSTQALTILDELHKGVKDTIGELCKGAKVAAPEVVGAVARAIFWTNLVPLVASGLIFFFLAGFAMKAYKKMWVWYQASESHNNYSYDPPVCPTLCIVFYSIGLLASTITWCCIWFDAMRWMGVFDQKAYLAQMILNKLSGG
jgi:hypothetical protein